ncbi:MAG: preprotein translocase subunit SecA [Candidatus Zixiibacteriota bacterium]|nr:MAG: preprotein translocase subunit SecA [candidate division Zixibacteria bacterium]
MLNFIHKMFGSKSDREVKRFWPVVAEINRHFEEFKDLTDEQLRTKTTEFRARLAQGETLDNLLPEAFAAVKAACRKLVGRQWEAAGHKITWDMIPYDVQLIGGMVLHQGKISEMATGEGKTLVATLPLYLNALESKGAHLVTVNDYLALRDSQWMGKIYEFLGLSVGCILSHMTPAERRVQYAADITYGTNNEFGFDYLRDNMAIRPEDVVQRSHHYAIVDEVDSVLIDEARTPLIISGPVSRSTHKFDELRGPVERLVKKQTDLINRFVGEAEKLLEGQQAADEYKAGEMVLIAHRGAPKNKRLQKLLQEPGVKRLMARVESDYIRDKKVHDLDDQLYFAIDEHHHTIDLMDMGRDELAKLTHSDANLFIIPDMAEEMVKIDNMDADGQAKLEMKQKLEELYIDRTERNHNIAQLLRAHMLYERDVEYVVEEGKRVIIVDEFTGRLQYGRRYSDGLHQAIEAKENVQIERETQTIATITLQNYFRLYDKLAGMTGTAETEESEFFGIYKLEVVVIPTNKPCIRQDQDDVVYKTKKEKYDAVLNEIEERYRHGQPVLVGTTNVEVSETLSRLLQRRKITHEVLNAKHHAREADIVARAGQPHAVTIATNMAGRGTDIKLGPGVVELGGLHILGTERHEARRIDRQLRGRSGRQGDPGSSSFYLSLEDDLMRLFGSERIAGIMDRLGVEEGEVITHPLITASIGRAQRRVEEQNFSIRKHLLEYDDVMNRQREVIYDLRNKVLYGGRSRKAEEADGEAEDQDGGPVEANGAQGALPDGLPELVARQVAERVPHYRREAVETRVLEALQARVHDGGLPRDTDSLARTLEELVVRSDLQAVNEGDDALVFEIMDEWVEGLFDRYAEGSESEGWNLEELQRSLASVIRVYLDPETLPSLQRDDVIAQVKQLAQEAFARRKAEIDAQLLTYFLHGAILAHIDEEWKDHLYEMDRLKEGVGLRAYGQKDPLVEFKREGYSLFQDMMDRVRERSLRAIFHAHIVGTQRAPERPAPRPQPQMTAVHQQATGMAYSTAQQAPARAEGGSSSAAAAEPASAKPAPLRTGKTPGRNEPCPCGSGKKYKHCHGA